MDAAPETSLEADLLSQFNILTICTGNICRSPLAELLLKLKLRDLPVAVHSAGTHALLDHQMPEPQLKIARDLGINEPETHRAKQLDLSDFESVDLVLAMGREHRSFAVRLTPRVLRKTFTSRELSRISSIVPSEDLLTTATGEPAERLRQAVEAAALNRGVALPPQDPAEYDVIDPYKRSQQIYCTSRDQLVASIDAVVAYLRRSLA